MTFNASEIHYEIIFTEIDMLYMRLKSSMHHILKMIEQENDFKGFYNAKKDVIVECDNISEFVKFQSLQRGFFNYIYYNSLILSSYSIFEYSLKLICLFVEENINPNLEFKDESRNILGNCIDYLRRSQMIDFNENEIDRNYMQINNVNKLRKLIAHFNSNLYQDNKLPLTKQKGYNVFKADKRLIILDNGQVYIDNTDYINTFVDISESFLKTIIEKIKTTANML